MQKRLRFGNFVSSKNDITLFVYLIFRSKDKFYMVEHVFTKKEVLLQIFCNVFYYVSEKFIAFHRIYTIDYIKVHQQYIIQQLGVR